MNYSVINPQEVEFKVGKTLLVVEAANTFYGFLLKARIEGVPFEEAFMECDSSIRVSPQVVGHYVGIQGEFEGLVFTGREGEWATLTVGEDHPFSSIGFDAMNASPSLIPYIAIDTFIINLEYYVLYLKSKQIMEDSEANWFTIDVQDGPSTISIDSRNGNKI